MHNQETSNTSELISGRARMLPQSNTNMSTRSAGFEPMTKQQANLSLLDAEVSQCGSIAFEREITLCVACCATIPTVPETVMALVAAFSGEVAVRPVVLTEEEWHPSTGQCLDVQVVPPGTKLSKLRLLAGMEAVDLLCICDPDLVIEPDGCRDILRVALAEAYEGRDVVVFGIVKGHDDGRLLAKLVATDKWLSHRFFRRLLWASHLGITLPGQFLIFSRSLLDHLQGDVDSYLDDLYLGLIAREQGVRVFRMPIMVGQEKPRSCWKSLLTQRIRWMKGLASLGWRFANRPSAITLLLIHYLVYHGFPILVGFGTVLLAIINPTFAAALFVSLAMILALASRQSFSTACFYLAVFPCLHLAATLLCWLPLNKSLLRRR